MEVADVSQFVRNASRFREVVGILAKYGFADWLHATNLEWTRTLLKQSRVEQLGELSREARIRQAITELGTTYIKLGQVLSTRPDLVGLELAEELAELRTRTPPDPPESVVQTVEEELGRPIDELFAEFDREPLASASIGQVHRAVLHDQTAVVVKVQHPGIEDRVHNDLEILLKLAELAQQHSSELKQYRPAETASDFHRTLLRELDFRSEQRNLERFRRNFRSDNGVMFPRPYPELSSRRVLTMDLLEGVNLSDAAALKSGDFDREDLARRGAKLFVEMIFRDGYYHADPHPGNLMVLPDAEGPGADNARSADASTSVIGVLDCGMIGRLDVGLREDIERALLGVVRGEHDAIVDVIMRRGSTPEDLDEDELRFDVEDFLDEYATQSLEDFDLSGCLNGIIDIVRRHKIVLPARIAMLLKVLVMLEGTSKQLSPTFNMIEIIEPYGRKAIEHTFSPQRWLQKISMRYRDWDNLMEIFPRDCADILHRMKKGSFDVQLSHRRLENTINRMVLGILTAALFMGSASVLSRSVPPLLWNISVPGAIGCTLALALGCSVIRSIHRSGH